MTGDKVVVQVKKKFIGPMIVSLVSIVISTINIKLTQSLL